MSDDPYHYVELSEDWSTRSGDLDAGDTTQAATSEHPINCDEDGSTGYSDFCDDETISAAPVNCYSADPSPATTLGKRKSFDRSEPSSSLSASYKRQTISDDSAEPYIIAHNTSVQRAMDTRGLPWGVQWEIARLVSLGHCTWHDISMSCLDLLRKEGLSPGPSDSDPDSPAATATTTTPAVLCAPIAPYIESVFRWNKALNKANSGHQRLSKETQATSPWPELDREDLAFKNYGPTGLLGSTHELGTWYGGKVSFTMRLQANKKGSFQFLLESPVLGPSSRFTRCYGSSWLIRVKLSAGNISNLESLKKLLLRPLILNGQVFRFFYAKNEKKDFSVYLMATNELYDGGIKLQHSPLNHQRAYYSFLEFFSKHNNIQDNSNQTMAKWAARTALGLSNSVPGLMLENSQIKREIDIVSPSCPSGVKHSSEMDMTDGCGLINLHALHMLHERLSLWKEVPVAIQCRLAGAKGLLLLHHGKEENSWEYPCVWLRPSQIKIQHTQGYQQIPAHKVIDTLRASHMQSSVKISREIIVNLFENGVSIGILTDLLCQFLKDTIFSLLQWDGQDAMPQLWAAVSKEGNVMAARIARESAWTARAYGIQLFGDQEDGDETDELFDDDSSHSVAWWGDEISGCPSSLEETVMAFLDSGFHPSSNVILAEKLHIVAKKAIKSCITKSRVKVPMSCSALIVPDVLGVLQEGEIHIKCSHRSLLRSDGQRSDRITGDVLVTRSPCKLPTDVQKVKAVFKPELDDYVNVIMFSIKGSRSLASMLGTGDYDGDMVTCIWQPSIVEQFNNANPIHMDPPTSLQDHFHIKNETVKEFLQRVPPTNPIDIQIQEIQKVFMTPLSDLHAVGTYSTLHENATYMLGYDDPTTTLLAWIFCTVLDGAKSGKTILPERYSLDRNHKTYGTQYSPRWKMERDRPSQQYILSRQSKPPFVMDVLREAAESAEEECLKQIADRFNSLTKVKDLDLTAPWQDAEARMKEMLSRPEESIRIIGEAHRSAMEAIKAHVVRVYDWCAGLVKGTSARASTTGVGVGLCAGPSRAATRGGKSSKKGGAEFTHRSIETRQDLLRRMSKEFVGGPPAAEVFVFSQEEVARLRASYAYLYDWTNHSGTRFPWNVAFNELGEIKLRANKDFKPISRDFYEKMSMRRL